MTIRYHGIGLLALLGLMLLTVACAPQTAAPEPAEVQVEAETEVEAESEPAAETPEAAADNGPSDYDVAQIEKAVAKAIRAETRAPTNAIVDATATPELDQAATEAPPSLADMLPNLGKAPEINNEVWINSEPLRLAELEGKVVLVEFWTYS